jgi:hypothetical protein
MKHIHQAHHVTQDEHAVPDLLLLRGSTTSFSSTYSPKRVSSSPVHNIDVFGIIFSALMNLLHRSCDRM